LKYRHGGKKKERLGEHGSEKGRGDKMRLRWKWKEKVEVKGKF